VATVSAAAAPTSLAGFLRRFWALTGGYWAAENKWKIRFFTSALVALTVCQVFIPVLINFWNQQIFDALEQRSMSRFLAMVGMAGGIIALNVLITVLHLRVKRTVQVGWREWLTSRVVSAWSSRGRHYHVTYLEGDHDNPDGRIAEDIRISTEVAVDLAHSLLYCVLLLVSFVNILWMVSGSLEFSLGSANIAIPGYLLYIALLYAAAGTLVAIWVGRPLVRSVNRRQGMEADFRFGLARIRENSLEIALLHGESDERRRLARLFEGVKAGWRQQTLALSNMMAFSSAYGILSGVFPILVAAPRYIWGSISLGVLMQTAQAFQQTSAALSWPVDNLGRVAEWRASVERVFGLVRAIDRVDVERAGQGQITVERAGAQPVLSFDHLALHEPDGAVLVEPFSARIYPGERVLIRGDASAAVRLFRAVARVWPWGQGRIGLPVGSRVFFMPQRPYMPFGTLRAALSYPDEPSELSTDAAQRALARVGLEHLASRVDEEDDWGDDLAVSEQQRVGFARLLVHRPDWIFVDGATDALDAAGREEMAAILALEFERATVIAIGGHAERESEFARRFQFDRVNGTVRFRELQRASPDKTSR
jgi:putative ATP-binding cassette transporter